MLEAISVQPNSCQNLSFCGVKTIYPFVYYIQIHIMLLCSTIKRCHCKHYICGKRGEVGEEVGGRYVPAETTKLNENCYYLLTYMVNKMVNSQVCTTDKILVKSTGRYNLTKTPSLCFN